MKYNVRFTFLMGLAAAFMLSAGAVEASPTVSISLTILPNPEFEKAMRTNLPEHEKVSETSTETQPQTALDASTGISAEEPGANIGVTAETTAPLTDNSEINTADFTQPIRAGP